MADPNNSLYSTDYNPQTPQSYRKREEASLGADNQDTRTIKRMFNTQVIGQSSDTNLGNTTYNVSMMEGVVETRKQSGQSGFASKTSRPFALDPTLTTGAPLPTQKEQLEFLDRNPAKDIEQDAGDVNEYIHQQMSLSKDSPVYFNLTTPLRDKDYYNPNQTVGHNTWFSKHQIDWGFRPPKIEIDEDKLKKVKKAQSIPFCRIIEDRVGTAAYGYGDSMDGAFDEDVVMIEILQNLTGLRISGSRQEFQDVQPRGSQRPLYFYNKNSGRSLEFTASFHQQEYPLEPLYSIAEKAQYLLRPYRHGDYGLIPKTIRVEIPGRVFRCYCTSAEATFDGEDYRGWSELGLNESNIGSIGNGTVYTGVAARIEQQTGRVFNTDIAYNSTCTDYRYGLSSMSVSFQFNILEEIKLTNYETIQEVEIRESVVREEKNKKDRDDAVQKAQMYIEEARKNGLEVGYTAEQLVLVNKDGEVVAILINEDGTITYPDESDPETSTLEQYNINKELEKMNSASNDSSVVDQMSPPINSGNLTREATRDEMILAIAESRKGEFPNTPIKELVKEVEEEFKDKSDEEVYDNYKEVNYASLAGSVELAEFLSNSTTIRMEQNTNTGAVEVKEKSEIPTMLAKIFANKLTTSQDLYNFCGIQQLRAEAKGSAEYRFFIYLECALPQPGNSEYGTYKKFEEVFDEELWSLAKKYNEESLKKKHFYCGSNDFENCYIDLDELVSAGSINSAQKDKFVENLKAIGEEEEEGGHQVLTMDAIAKNPYNTSKDIFKIRVSLTEGGLDNTILEVVSSILKEFQKYLMASINRYTEECFRFVRDYALDTGPSSGELHNVLKNRKLYMYSNRSNDSNAGGKKSMETKRLSDKKNKKEIPGATAWNPIFSNGVYDNFYNIYGYYWVTVRLFG